MTPIPSLDLESARNAAARAIDQADFRLRELSLAIHGNPELGFEEYSAHQLLTDLLEAEGFKVERGAFDMPTASRATAGSGSPTIAVFCEYDGLQGIGHARGITLSRRQVLLSALPCGVHFAKARVRSSSSAGIPTDAVNHTPGFTASAATPEAHRRMLRAAKALALTALDLYGDPSLLARAKEEFASRTA
jgi:metal-dependent amidase/aminoacylase/carboxypeptidase family protein